MKTKEYIVLLKEDVDLAAFWSEIESIGNLSPMVPTRQVQIANPRDLFPRKCHYYLTTAEAEMLRTDIRVASVSVPVELNPDISLQHNRVTQDRNNFSKTSSGEGSFVNWGLVRNSLLFNAYGAGTATSTGYGYFVDGTGVDVVIIDSGIQANHPEFQQVDLAVSRVQQINWFERAGFNPAFQPANFYTDYDGHGTHVTGIAAGKTYGWAKNANIFSIKLNDLKGPADPGMGLTWDQTADVLLGWHQNKMNPASQWYTGRPTVVNMSFATGVNIVNVFQLLGGTWRDQSWTGSSWGTTQYGLTFSSNTLPVRLPDIDADVQAFINAGMTICIAAGNENLKIDIPNGADYNNTIRTVESVQDIGNTFPYMRGASPFAPTGITVGAMDSVTWQNTGLDQKATYSMAGPAIDIFAAGTYIMSACSNVSNTVRNGASFPYWWDKDNFKQMNISGTSMASPQIAGIAACYLQQNPSATPAQVKSWILNNATYTIYKTASAQANDYSNNRSQWGGNAPVAFAATQGALIKKNYTTWQPLSNIQIKTGETTWKPVGKIWVKTSSNTWKQVY